MKAVERTSDSRRKGACCRSASWACARRATRSLTNSLPSDASSAGARARALLAGTPPRAIAEAINQLGILHEDGLIVCDASEKTKDKSDRGEHDDDGIRSFVVAKRLYGRARVWGTNARRTTLVFCALRRANTPRRCGALPRRRARARRRGRRAQPRSLLRDGRGRGEGPEGSRAFVRGGGGEGARGRRSARVRRHASRRATRHARGRRPPGSSGAASLRRRLAAKENETARLAKDLGEAKAETTRLKGKIAELKVRNADLEKTKARKAEGSMPSAIPSGFDATAKEKAGFGIGRDPGSAIERPREFTRSTSLMSDRTTHSNYSAYSGLSERLRAGRERAAAEGAAGPARARLAGRDPERLGAKGSTGSSTAGGSSSAARWSDGGAARLAAQKRASRKSVKSLRSGASGFAGVFGMLSGATRGGSGSSVPPRGRRRRRGGPRADEGARARDVRAETRDGGGAFQGGDARGDVLDALRVAQSHVRGRICSSRSCSRASTSTRTSEAVAKGLHPIKLERVAGVAVGDAGVFRDGAKRKKEEHALSLAPATRGRREG